MFLKQIAESVRQVFPQFKEAYESENVMNFNRIKSFLLKAQDRIIQGVANG